MAALGSGRTASCTSRWATTATVPKLRISAIRTGRSCGLTRTALYQPIIRLLASPASWGRSGPTDSAIPGAFSSTAATGKLYGGDVGNFSWEEVNHIVKGGNYGWPLHEGECTSGCTGYIDPIYTYPHDGESAAVTGGPVYRGEMFPSEYQGDLFFGDYAKGFIKSADLGSNGNISAVHNFDNQAGSVVDLKVAPDGSLYYITYYPGALYRISYNTTSHLPVANASADVTKGTKPLTVHFSSAGSRDPDGGELQYLWKIGDGTISNDESPTKTYDEKGVYTARLTVSAGGGQAQAQPIVIQVGIPPVLTVSAPTEGDLYRAGGTKSRTTLSLTTRRAST